MIQCLMKIISSLPSLSKIELSLYPSCTDISLLTFCSEQKFKTELDFEFSDIDINQLDNRTKNMITSIIDSQLLNSDNLPSLQKLKLQMNAGENIPKKLCDPQLMPKLAIIEIYGFHFSPITKRRFENFMHVNGHRLKRLDVHIVDEASQLVQIVSKATNLDKLTITFDGEILPTLNDNDAQSLYQMRVKFGIVIRSDRHVLRQLFQTASEEVIDKKCKITIKSLQDPECNII